MDIAKYGTTTIGYEGARRLIEEFAYNDGFSHGGGMYRDLAAQTIAAATITKHQIGLLRTVWVRNYRKALRERAELDAADIREEASIERCIAERCMPGEYVCAEQCI
jgi:hypothetical protein